MKAAPLVDAQPMPVAVRLLPSIAHSAERLVGALGLFAGLGVLAMVATVGYEVASRAVFGEPTSWATEYSTYFMIAVAFLGAGYAHLDGSHVRADLALSLVGPARRQTLELLAAWAGLGFVALTAWNAVVHVQLDLINDTRIWGVMQTPLWVPKLAMPIGVAGLAISMLVEIPRLAPIPGGVRRFAPPLLFLAVAAALPFLSAAPIFGPLDAQTIVILFAVLAGAALWNGVRIALLTAAVLLALGVAFHVAGSQSAGSILLALVLAIVILLALGIRIAFAIGLIGAAGVLLLLPTPQMQVLAERGWSSVDSFSLTALPMFVLMGAFLIRSGLSASVFAVAAHALRRVPGGLAHASILGSAVFAAVSGSSVATAATIGSVACPEMEARRYSIRLTYGVVAAGGTLGILIPPSIAMLIYGSAVGASVPALFIAGIVPGLLLTLLFMAVVAVWVRRQPIAGADESAAPPPGTGWRVLPVGILIFGVLGSMYFGIATATEAGGIGAILAFMLCFTNRDFGTSAMVASILETVKVTSFLLLIVVATGILSYVFDFLRAATFLIELVKSADAAPWLVAVFICGVYVLLGMFIDPISMMLMTLPVAYPLALSLGHDPVWFGIALVLLIEVGLITPPVGMNLFVLRGIAPNTSLGNIAYGALPFVGAIGFLLVLIYLVPDIVLWLPAHMR